MTKTNDSSNKPEAQPSPSSKCPQCGSPMRDFKMKKYAGPSNIAICDHSWHDEPSPSLPATPNSRRRPLAFESRDEARDYSKTSGLKVWAKIWSWCGVFEIYPGGREVWHKND